MSECCVCFVSGWRVRARLDEQNVTWWDRGQAIHVNGAGWITCLQIIYCHQFLVLGYRLLNRDWVVKVGVGYGWWFSYQYFFHHNIGTEMIHKGFGELSMVYWELYTCKISVTVFIKVQATQESCQPCRKITGVYQLVLDPVFIYCLAPVTCSHVHWRVSYAPSKLPTSVMWNYFAYVQWNKYILF